MLKTNLELAQNRMRVHANKHMAEMEFVVRDYVYLRLIPYPLQSLASHAYHKLHPRYYAYHTLAELFFFLFFFNV